MTTPESRPVEPAKPDYLLIWRDAHIANGTLNGVTRARATLYGNAYNTAMNAMADIVDDDEARSRAAHAIAMQSTDNLMGTRDGVGVTADAEVIAHQSVSNDLIKRRQRYNSEMQEYQAALEAWQKEQDGEAADG